MSSPAHPKKQPAKEVVDLSESDSESDVDHSGDCTVCGKGVIEWEEGYICTGCGECLEDNGEIDVRADFYKQGKEPKGCSNCGASLYKTKKTDGYCDNCNEGNYSKSKKQGSSKRKAEAESDHQEEEKPKKQKTAPAKPSLSAMKEESTAAAADSAPEKAKKEPVDVLLVHFTLTSDWSGEEVSKDVRLVKVSDLPGPLGKHRLTEQTAKIDDFLAKQMYVDYHSENADDEDRSDDEEEEKDEKKESVLIEDFDSYPFDSCYRVVAFTSVDVTI